MIVDEKSKIAFVVKAVQIRQYARQLIQEFGSATIF